MDNPRAFASAGYATARQYVPGQPGMTLRDYFAGQALVCSAAVATILTKHGQSYTEQQSAETAYRIADAMLLARNTGENRNGETAA